MGASCNAANLLDALIKQQTLCIKPEFRLACFGLGLAFCPAGDVCELGQRWPLLSWTGAGPSESGGPGHSNRALHAQPL